MTSEEIYEEYTNIVSNFHVKPKKIDDVQIEEGLNWEDFHKANMVNNKPYCKGWVLYDFPHNYA